MQTVYFYGVIEESSIKKLLQDVTDAISRELEETESTYRQVRLFITSEGGSLSYAMHAHDVLKLLCAESDTQLVTVATGYCQSAATLLLQAGEVRYSMPHTFFMVHTPYQDSWSDEGVELFELNERQRLFSQTISMMAELLSKRSGLPLDLWMTRLKEPGRTFLRSEDAKTYGLIDTIYYPLESNEYDHLSRRPA